ncbi:MAG: tetratricopeptide repeat protein [Candidatus Omnitrophota bacterium]|nr:tetratricopeptide repeat protein [Candidatus Omnitrophota bacterium]
MNNRLPPKLIITAIAILSVLCFAGLTFAQELKAAPLVEDISDVKQEQARKYRELGLEYQRTGNLVQALSFYQKAVAIYPNFAVAYNDIGVVYEAMGSVDRAEENYLKSIKIDPAYSSVYTNLALLYEGQRNLEKAVFYWGKRVEVGAQDDPWTQKAAKRLGDIRMSLSGRPFSDEREEEVLGLMKDIAGNKTEFNQDDKTLAQTHFKKAKLSFNRGDMAMAIKEALDAQYLDQDNPEIEAFIEKAELRALTR